MPIIKSKGRKDNMFGQLIDYLHRDDDRLEYTYTYLHNMPEVNPDNKQQIISSFKENDTFRKKRKNGVGIYHEIIAFHPKDRKVVLENPYLLDEFTRVYLAERAPNSIAIAKPHYDKDHIHIHFMIAANQVRSKRGTRISREKYLEIHKTIEALQVHRYPELEYSYVSSQSRKMAVGKGLSYSLAEWQMKQRGVSLDEKNKASHALKQALEQATSFNKLDSILKSQGIELYKYRGKFNGVKIGKRKYRFTKLLAGNETQLEKIKNWQEQIRRVTKKKGKGLELGRELSREIGDDF